MKILVTGGAGFIGSQVVDAYVADGHDVVIIDDLSTGEAGNVNSRARLVTMSIVDPAIQEVLERERPEAVNHHAAQIDLRFSVARPLDDARINVLGTIQLVDQAVRSGTRRFIFASSGGAIYGDQAGYPAVEEHPTRPASPYGCAKLAGEAYLHTYHLNHGLEVVSLRYANVYGPRQSHRGEAGVVAIFADRMLSGKPPVINGDGEQTRDFVFVGDVVEANRRALALAGSGTFNIGTGVETSINTVYATLRDVLGATGDPERAPAKAGEQRRSVLDHTRATRVLGWEPRVDFATGIGRTVDYFRSRR